MGRNVRKNIAIKIWHDDNIKCLRRVGQLGSTDVDAAVRAIVAAKPDVVLSSVVGDSALAFAKKLRAAGIRPEQMPVMTFAIGENELRTTARDDFAGNYAAWNYFQSIDRPENQAFVRSFKARYGSDRSTSDVIEASYNSVKLWAQAVREAGTTDVRQVRNALRQQSLNAPEGIIVVDPATQHTWRPVSILSGRAGRQSARCPSRSHVPDRNGRRSSTSSTATGAGNGKTPRSNRAPQGAPSARAATGTAT